MAVSFLKPLPQTDLDLIAQVQKALDRSTPELTSLQNKVSQGSLLSAAQRDRLAYQIRAPRSSLLQLQARAERAASRRFIQTEGLNLLGLQRARRFSSVASGARMGAAEATVGARVLFRGLSRFLGAAAVALTAYEIYCQITGDDPISRFLSNLKEGKRSESPHDSEPLVVKEPGLPPIVKPTDEELHLAHRLHALDPDISFHTHLSRILANRRFKKGLSPNAIRASATTTTSSSLSEASGSLRKKFKEKVKEAREKVKADARPEARSIEEKLSLIEGQSLPQQLQTLRTFNSYCLRNSIKGPTFLGLKWLAESTDILNLLGGTRSEIPRLFGLDAQGRPSFNVPLTVKPPSTLDVHPSAVGQADVIFLEHRREGSKELAYFRIEALLLTQDVVGTSQVLFHRQQLQTQEGYPKPVQVTLLNGKAYLNDGHHRLYSALQEGQTYILGEIVPATRVYSQTYRFDQLRFLTDEEHAAAKAAAQYGSGLNFSDINILDE